MNLNSFDELAIDLGPDINWAVTNNSHGIYRTLHQEFTEVDFIGFVGSRLEESWEKPRIDVFSRFARERVIHFALILQNIPGMDSQESFVHEEAIEKRREIGFLATKKLKDAIRQYQHPLRVGANDSYAMGILEFLSRNQVKVPEEVKVIGYDNRNEAMENNLSSFDLNFFQ